MAMKKVLDCSVEVHRMVKRTEEDAFVLFIDNSFEAIDVQMGLIKEKSLCIAMAFGVLVTISRGIYGFHSRGSIIHEYE